MRRVCLVVVLFASAALAQGRPDAPDRSRRPTSDEVEQVRTIVGGEAWGLMAEWRRRDVVRRYLRFLGASPRQQESIRGSGLKAYLTTHSTHHGPKLPPDLQELVDGLEPDQRRAATKIVLVRIRQRRLDRNLTLLPQANRLAWFERLFPEPFDPASARTARLEFEKKVAGGVAKSLRPKVASMKDLEERERRTQIIALVRSDTEKRERRLLAAVAKDLRRFKQQFGTAASRKLSPEFELILGRRDVFATPRQRELLRWALRPAKCPLLDFSWMGERPKERNERRQWDRDVSTLGRMELLTRADFPSDVVLHLAATGSDADFMRAARHLLGGAPGGSRNRSDHRPGRDAPRRPSDRREKER